MIVHRTIWSAKIEGALDRVVAATPLPAEEGSRLRVWCRLYGLRLDEAQAIADLLSAGLPVQVPAPQGRWIHPPLTFTTVAGDDAHTQAILLDAIRALAAAGRRSEAVAWYALEFKASDEQSERAVRLTLR